MNNLLLVSLNQSYKVINPKWQTRKWLLSGGAQGCRGGLEMVYNGVVEELRRMQVTVQEVQRRSERLQGHERCGSGKVREGMQEV